MNLFTPERLRYLEYHLRQFLFRWELPYDTELSLLAISENASFIAKWKDQKRVFRIYRAGYHSSQEIFSELSWMQALAQGNHVRIPHIYPTADDTLFINLKEPPGKSGLPRIWRIVCFEYIEGSSPVLDSYLPHWFEKIGMVSAWLHQSAIQWPKPFGFCRKHWTYQTMIGPGSYWGNWRQAKLESNERELLEQCDAALQQSITELPQNDDDVILLHADLRPANLIIENNQMAVIDFDDCGFSWKALDFANAISFIEDHPMVPTLQTAWLKGYARVTTPEPEMIAAIPICTMLRRMQLTAWVANRSDTLLAQTIGSTFATNTAKLAKGFLDNL